MLVPAIVLAVIAAALAWLLITTRKQAAQDRKAAAATEAELTAERDEARTRSKALTGERDKARKQVDTLEADVSERGATIERLEGELTEVRASLGERESDLEQAKARADGLDTELAEARSAIEVAETAAAAATARASEIVLGELSEGGARTQTLWNLEIARSERTWRTSVSINPESDRSPFHQAEDEARLAVEIEASALRENVGASVEVDWQAGPVEDPTQRHLVVRVAQELLEAAARSPEPSILRVHEVEGEITLGLEAVDGDDRVINIIPPQITSDLLEFRDEGRQVTVAAG